MTSLFLLGCAIIGIMLLRRRLKLRKAAKMAVLSIDINDVLASVPEIQPAFPPKRARRVDRDDDAPVSTSGKASTTLKGSAFFIVYQAADGNISERRIIVDRVYKKPSDFFIQAFCLEREARRSFYASRIQELTDLGTGEIVTNAIEYFSELIGVDSTEEAQKLQASLPMTESVAASYADKLNSLQDEVLALVFMARADGRMIKAERAVIVDYIIRRDPTLCAMKEKLDASVARLYPNKSLVAESVNRIMALPVDGQRGIYLALDAVMKADDQVKETELSMIKQYRDAIEKNIAA